MENSERGVIWWDFDGTLAFRPAMWFEVLYAQLKTKIPAHAIDAALLNEQMNFGFPWHGNGIHADLRDAHEWWAAVYARMEGALTAVGLPGSLTRADFEAIRVSILDGRRYHLYPDVVPVLELLSRRGWCHMVVSNHVPELRKILIDLDIDRYFRKIITSGEIGYEKPNIEIYQHARNLSGPAASIWMLGDNLANDCLVPRRLGVNSILVRNCVATGEAICPDLWRVLDWIV